MGGSCELHWTRLFISDSRILNLFVGRDWMRLRAQSQKLQSPSNPAKGISHQFEGRRLNVAGLDASDINKYRSKKASNLGLRKYSNNADVLLSGALRSIPVLGGDAGTIKKQFDCAGLLTVHRFSPQVS